MSRRGVVEDEDDAEVEMEREARQLTTSEQWWRVRALLDMIEMLDKLIVYTCRGAIFQLSTVSQVSNEFGIKEFSLETGTYTMEHIRCFEIECY